MQFKAYSGLFFNIRHKRAGMHIAQLYGSLYMFLSVINIKNKIGDTKNPGVVKIFTFNYLILWVKFCDSNK